MQSPLCSVETVRQAIASGLASDVVPKFLYHFGIPQYLLEDAEHGNVPEEAWRNFIMGSQTRYELGTERRGLYGTDGIDTNIYSSPEKFNWMMRIQVRADCRKAERVFSLKSFWQDARFIDWFTSNSRQGISSLELVAEKCEMIDYNFKGLDGESAQLCRQLLLDFMHEQSVTIVQDHFYQKSFYIRDRSCIEGIQAQPKELLHIFMHNKDLWGTPCGLEPARSGLDDVIPEVLLRLHRPMEEDEYSTLLDNQKLRYLKSLPLPDFLHTVLLAHQRCQRTQQMKEYERIQRQAPPIEESQPLFDSICR